MVRTSDWSHETVLAAEPMSVSRARDFVCLHLAAHGLRYLVEDVRLVVSELAGNAVTHAGTPFRLTLAGGDGSVRVGVTDRSVSVPIKVPPGDMAVNGRGLLLVEMLARDWGTSTDTPGLKTVWASFPS